MSDSKIAWGTPAHPAIVAVCTPVLDKIDPYFWQCMTHLRKPGLSRGAQGMYGKTYLCNVFGQLIEDARNILTEQALAPPDTTHVMFIDDDMTFEPGAMERLLKHDAPVVGGLCFNRRPPYNPILRKYHDPEWGFPEKTGGWVYHYPPDELFEVDGTGAAFLLIKREVFDAITTKYGAREWWTRTHGDAEDLSFCRKVRDLGIPIVVDTGCKIGHRGTVLIDEDFAVRNRGNAEWASWAPPAELTRAIGEPVASVVIPTYNQKPEYLRAAILSALSQTLPVEVIVVDDGSSPRVEEVIGEKLLERVKIVSHPENRGISAGLNSGIHMASTPWICWLSSDDLFAPTKVERQLNALRQSGAKAGYHSYNVIFPDGRASPGPCPIFKGVAEQNAALLQFCAFNGSTTMIHRDVFEKVGDFDESLRWGQDYEMWLRIGFAGFRWHGLGEVLGTRREGENLTTEINADAEKAAKRDAEDEKIRARFRNSNLTFAGT